MAISAAKWMVAGRFAGVEVKEHLARGYIVETAFLEALEAAVGFDGIVSVGLTPGVGLGGKIVIGVLVAIHQYGLGHQTAHIVPGLVGRPFLAVGADH